MLKTCQNDVNPPWITAAVPAEEIHHVQPPFIKIERRQRAAIRCGGVRFQWIWRSLTGIEGGGARPRCTRAGPTLLCSSGSLLSGRALGIQTHSQMSSRSFGQWVIQTDRSEKPERHRVPTPSPGWGGHIHPVSRRTLTARPNLQTYSRTTFQSARAPHVSGIFFFSPPKFPLLRRRTYVTHELTVGENLMGIIKYQELNQGCNGNKMKRHHDNI